MKLLLDDDEERYLRAERISPGWTWARTVNEARALLGYKAGRFTELSVDNDLGEGTLEGFKLLDWLEEMVNTYPDFIAPRVISVHSMNAARIRSMQVTAQRIIEKGANAK